MKLEEVSLFTSLYPLFCLTIKYNIKQTHNVKYTITLTKHINDKPTFLFIFFFSLLYLSSLVIHPGYK
jgi:hypothetical protein